MKIIVIADVSMQKEFESKGIAEGVEIHFETSVRASHNEADAYFYLLNESVLHNDLNLLGKLEKPVFVNAVISTLTQLPRNAIRINAWPGFIQQAIQEVCTTPENEAHVKEIFQLLQWKYKPVADVVGMISPRIIAMIINEAFFALGDGVSTKEEINTAMKLGTNYPYGPFEWCDKIGIENICNLLEALSKSDERYIPAPFLTQDIHH